MWNQPIVITDLETTGLNPNLQEIIEIGAVKISQPDFKILGWMNVKVKPERIEFASPKALEVNGYTEADWVDALEQSVAMKQYADFATNCVFAAYNVTFDWGFIDATMTRLGIKHSISYHRLDLLSLSWMYNRDKGYKYIRLKDSCGYLGVRPEPAVHRAVLGALTGVRVFRAMMNPDNKLLSEAELDDLEEEILAPKVSLTPEILQALKETDEELDQIGSKGDWEAAHKAAEEILKKPDEIEFS